LEYYNKHFECAKLEKKEKDRVLIDKARVILGMAKANQNISTFIKTVQTADGNMKPLLDWKGKKDK